MSSTRTAEAGGARSTTLRAWSGFLAPHVAWAVHIMVIYPLVPLVCRTGQTWLLWALSIVTLAIAAAAGVSGYFLERELRGIREEAAAARRNHFLARAAIITAIFFFVVIVLETLPLLFRDPCS